MKRSPSGRKALCVAAVCATVLLAGCQQLFTTSLASSLARETKVPSNLTVDQAQEYYDNLSSLPAAQQKTVANDLFDQYAAFIAAETDATKKAELQKQAVQLAIVGSGMDGITQTLTNLPSNPTTEQLQAAAADFVATIDSANAAEAVAIITQMQTDGTATGDQLVMVAMLQAVDEMGGDINNTSAIQPATQQLFTDGVTALQASGSSSIADMLGQAIGLSS